MRVAVADWSATNVATLTEADQESAKEIFEARVREGGKAPPAKKKKAPSQPVTKRAARAKKQVAYHMFSSDSSDSSSSDDDDEEEEEPQAPPPKKKQKKASEDPPKKSVADVARQMVDERAAMISQGASEATMKQLMALQASMFAAINKEE
jgi:hypothetical protein